MIVFTKEQYEQLEWFISHSLYPPYEYSSRKGKNFQMENEMEGYPHYVRVSWLIQLRDKGLVQVPESIAKQINEAIDRKESLIFAGPRQNATIE